MSRHLSERCSRSNHTRSHGLVALRCASVLSLVCRTAVLLLGFAISARAQSTGVTPGWSVTPAIGVGTSGRGSVNVHAVLGVDWTMATGLRPGLSLSRWATPQTCTPSGDPDRDVARCASAGWFVDMGMDYVLAPATARIAPYLGVGAGAARVGERRAALNARVGLDLNARGLGPRVEARVYRLMQSSRGLFVATFIGLAIR